jgi:hypothetical protein
LIDVFAPITLVDVMGIVTGCGPQRNVTAPPPTSAALNAASVQLAAVSLPTTPAAYDGATATASAVSVMEARTSARAARVRQIERANGIIGRTLKQREEGG